MYVYLPSSLGEKRKLSKKTQKPTKEYLLRKNALSKFFSLSHLLLPIVRYKSVTVWRKFLQCKYPSQSIYPAFLEMCIYSELSAVTPKTEPTQRKLVKLSDFIYLWRDQYGSFSDNVKNSLLFYVSISLGYDMYIFF